MCPRDALVPQPLGRANLLSLYPLPPAAAKPARSKSLCLRSSGAFWIKPDGRVWVTEKLVWETACDMKYDEHPYDVHACHIIVNCMRESSSAVQLDVFDHGLAFPISTDCGGTVATEA